MKRPEGFDRVPPPRPRAEEPVVDETAEAPVDESTSEKSPTTRGVRPSLGAAKAAVARAASGTATKERGGAEKTPVDEAVADPARIDPVDTGASEARTRASAARRLARRAASARRAVERSEVRRFTRRSRHRRAGWIAAGVVVVVLVGSVTISVFSPLLSLQTIKVEGTSRVSKAAVLDSLHDQIGKPLAMVDFTQVKSDLSDFPLIESYVTETEPPHTLVIKITERQPIASVKISSGYELVDPAGIVIQTSPKQPAGYPVVDIKGATISGSVYRAAAEVLLSLPATLRASVTKVTASTADDVTLNLKTGEQVVWGSADSSTQKAALLTGLIKSHKATNPSQPVEYDVSAPDNGIIRTK
ncbi:FtsQ-type POTRA domain-containing protein [Frondihabitans australicus]|uniref:Cell division protein FtsQ n=1 Tax=Frondihabitans australicus TaxID=386892 RepID=A0A495IE74_9MICO|nr:FtsQ-type POTRA domain-containing protein [Frondihabitans australicus]RKR74304.1 cell division protein FtsQ [Frondihabitans australicus]